MNEPKLTLGGLVAGAVIGGVIAFLLIAMIAFAVPGPGGWASWRVGLLASPVGGIIGSLSYVAWMDAQKEQWGKGNR